MKTEHIEISHPDKILFPEEDITKKGLAGYAEKIAPYMLPHILARPLTLKQYPQGIDNDGFFHKHAAEYFPDYIARIAVPMHSQDNKIMQMVTADESADLVYFAGQNVIELHMGLVKTGNLEKPDQIIIDLDPSDNDFEKVRTVAFVLKTLLDQMSVSSFVKTTGSRGVHLHIPLKVEHEFAKVKDVAHNLAQVLHRKCPQLTTLEMHKDKRGNRVFLDYLRNDYGMTAIAPYSLRAVASAAAATPIDWDELKDNSLGPQSYGYRNIFRRLPHKENPWESFYKSRVGLAKLQL